jgi:hypothetical protein
MRHDHFRRQVTRHHEHEHEHEPEHARRQRGVTKDVVRHENGCEGRDDDSFSDREDMLQKW